METLTLWTKRKQTKTSADWNVDASIDQNIEIVTTVTEIFNFAVNENY